MELFVWINTVFFLKHFLSRKSPTMKLICGLLGLDEQMFEKALLYRVEYLSLLSLPSYLFPSSLSSLPGDQHRLRNPPLAAQTPSPPLSVFPTLSYPFHPPSIIENWDEESGYGCWKIENLSHSLSLLSFPILSYPGFIFSLPKTCRKFEKCEMPPRSSCTESCSTFSWLRLTSGCRPEK